MVTKSLARNTCLTPSTRKRALQGVKGRLKRTLLYFANGEDFASPGVLKCAVPAGRTARPGRNMRLFALGVSRTWINMERR